MSSAIPANKFLELFHEAADQIPAYSKFLAANDCRPNKIKTVEDFKLVPVTSKKQYLKAYSSDDLLWPASRELLTLYCSTSGSTGEPYYFPRDIRLAEQMSYLVEDFILQSSYGKGRTLVLLGFGMGVWIGGIITLRAFELAGSRLEYPISILPTGYNKKELFKALKKLAPEFDQVILVGYPPFTKEVIDEAEQEGIDLGKLNLRLMFAAEAFTETFRNYLCEKAGIENPCLDTLNIYGTADIGAMAFETPVSILVRRLAREDPLLFKEMFRQIEKTPTLAQYNPEFMHFEEVDGEVVLTGDAALPLIRYAVGDSGGVFEYMDIAKLFDRYGINLQKQIEQAGIADFVKRWPFVFVYERVDFSCTLHGINIYPEFIKEALLTPEAIRSFTEKFTMSTKHDIRHNQFLQVNLELKKNIEPNIELTKKIKKLITDTLKQKSSEFSEISKSKKSSDLIQVILWPNGDPRYFAPGTKQSWVEKA